MSGKAVVESVFPVPQCMIFHPVNLVSFISLISEAGEVTFQPLLDIDKKLLHGWIPDVLCRWK